jgi:hypothetical protein
MKSIACISIMEINQVEKVLYKFLLNFIIFFMILERTILNWIIGTILNVTNLKFKKKQTGRHTNSKHIVFGSDPRS